MNSTMGLSLLPIILLLMSLKMEELLFQSLVAILIFHLMLVFKRSTGEIHDLDIEFIETTRILAPVFFLKTNESQRLKNSLDVQRL